MGGCNVVCIRPYYYPIPLLINKAHEEVNSAIDTKLGYVEGNVVVAAIIPVFASESLGV